MGLLGLKLLLRLSYATDYLHLSADVDKVYQIFNPLWEEEVTRAQDVSAAGKQRRPMKSSIFRSANRRLSHTEMLHVYAKQLHIIVRIKRVPSYPNILRTIPRLLG